MFNRNEKQNRQNELVRQIALLSKEQTSGLAFSLATFLPYILVMLFAVAGAMFGLFHEGAEEEDWYLYMGFFLPQISFALVAILYFSMTKTPVRTIVGTPKPLDFALAVGVQFGLLSLGFVNGWFIEWLNGFGASVAEPQIPSLDGFGLYGVLFVVALLPAIFEEVLFRGILVRGLSSFPWWVVVLVSGGMFSLFHQNPAQTLYQCFCGMAFALIALRARSILPTALAHFLNNAFIILCEKFAWNVYGLPLMIASSILLLLTVGFLVYGHIQSDKGKPKREKGSLKQFFLCAAVGLVVCVIGWISGLFGG